MKKNKHTHEIANSMPRRIPRKKVSNFCFLSRIDGRLGGLVEAVAFAWYSAN